MTYMNQELTNEILTICARTEAILNGCDDELLDLIAEQTIDRKGNAKGEYLGGNGVAQWHHVKARNEAASNIDNSVDDEVTIEERAILAAAVEEHQTGIECNGAYNVRQLAHWKGGFNGEKFAKRNDRVARKNADHGYKFDRRKKIGDKKSEQLKEMRRTMSNAEYQRAVRAMKKAEQA